ncbi:SDR family NAD(P)-dependent oxidoreductase [Chondrinema litorale]|uniref:SDR family NAD(P)-dependent oxidoreductase n=1 Tax=Chondrinema litorale TaxID=2994555 RepID=UPI0025436471|nr:SDR family NAD(P)-dependent oxidoreductase [Chondrinema litorale]UZR98445.1 SDR family NAD(P)-dependent oxidoreductase [Chondrinema litorale]
MKVTLITGASGGIGKAIAFEFAAKGHHLLLVARNKEKLSTICSELHVKFKIEAHYITADLCDKNSPQFIYEESKRRGLSINILVNNAGKGSSGEFYKNILDSELEIIQLNNASLVALSHYFVKDMIAKKSGYIINIASMIAFIPSPYMAVYAGSKHFLKTFTYSFAEECKPYNVKVMLFSPGLTTSNFMNTKENNNDWGKTLTANSNTQTPEEVANELMIAFGKEKVFHVSGSKNRFFVKMTGLMSQRFIAKTFGKQKRNQMGLK